MSNSYSYSYSSTVMAASCGNPSVLGTEIGVLQMPGDFSTFQCSPKHVAPFSHSTAFAFARTLVVAEANVSP